MSETPTRPWERKPEPFDTKSWSPGLKTAWQEYCAGRLSAEEFQKKLKDKPKWSIEFSKNLKSHRLVKVKRSEQSGGKIDETGWRIKRPDDDPENPYPLTYSIYHSESKGRSVLGIIVEQISTGAYKIVPLEDLFEWNS